MDELEKRGAEMVVAARSALNDILEEKGLGSAKNIPQEWNINYSSEMTFIGDDGEMRVAPQRAMIFENDDEIIFTTIMYIPKSKIRLV